MVKVIKKQRFDPVKFSKRAAMRVVPKHNVSPAELAILVETWGSAILENDIHPHYVLAVPAKITEKDIEWAETHLKIKQ